MSSAPKPVSWGFVGASGWASSYLTPAVQAVPDAHAVGVFSSLRERGQSFAEAAGGRAVKPGHL